MANKPFLNYTDQINNLINNKHLIINDIDFANSTLHDVCYYSLIDGYKGLFYNLTNNSYETGTKFEDIVSLYQFDAVLRSLVFKYICIIEQKMRSCISYSFCETYSENQSAYLNTSNYDYIPKNKNAINQLIKILDYQANKNTEHKYVVYQRNTYKNVPLWVLMQTLTLGQTSKMFSILPNNIQVKISSNYQHINEKELSQFLKVITNFRNICAHNSRLYSFKSGYEIPNTTIHKKMNIPLKGNHYICGKRDLFALVIAFRYLLKPSDFVSFKKELTLLINTFSKNTSASKKDKLLVSMGFPSNWNNIARYKL